MCGLRFDAAELIYTVGQASGGPKMVGEVIIYNFAEPELPLFSGD